MRLIPSSFNWFVYITIAEAREPGWNEKFSKPTLPPTKFVYTVTIIRWAKPLFVEGWKYKIFNRFDVFHIIEKISEQCCCAIEV